jgi:hypothetical protein
VTSAVYKKSFTLSSKSRQTSTIGEIVNLQAVDTGRLQEVLPYLHMVWSAPLQGNNPLPLKYNNIKYLKSKKKFNLNVTYNLFSLLLLIITSNCFPLYALGTPGP